MQYQQTLPPAHPHTLTDSDIIHQLKFIQSDGQKILPDYTAHFLDWEAELHISDGTCISLARFKIE